MAKTVSKNIHYARERCLAFMAVRRKYKKRAKTILAMLHKVDASSINHNIKESYRNTLYEFDYENTCDLEEVYKEIVFWIGCYRSSKDRLPIVSCNKPCSPSDFVIFGKCHSNGCLYETGS